MDPRGVCIKRPFPAEQAHSSMFSCAKSGPLSGSGCEGMEKQRRRHKLTAKRRDGEEEEEGTGNGGKREEREERENIAESLSRFFVCLVKWRTRHRHKGI